MDETTTKELAEAVASAHIVAHPGPHVYWGTRELALFTGLGVKGLRDMLAMPDFPQPAVSESQKNRRWRSLEVVRWYEARMCRPGRQRAA